MKKIIFIILCFIFGVHVCSAQVNRYLQSGTHPEPTGFRGIEWGQHISAIPNMKSIGPFNFYENKSNLSGYVREKDPLEIGYGKAEEIVYLFWQNRFYGVVINSLGNTNRNEFEKAVANWIGRPTIERDISGVQYMEWQRASVRVTLEFRKTVLARKQDVILSVISREMESLFMGF